MKNIFYFPFNALSMILRYLRFSPDFSVHIEKGLDKRANVNFTIYDVLNWDTNNYGTHIAQYFKKWRQWDFEIWLVNRI